MTSNERQAELVTALGALRGRIADACAGAGRDPRELTLVAVTKTYPASDVATLAQLGVHDVGESKDQEARAKRDDLGAVADGLRWHLVGRLQTNKARSVAGFAHAVHSVDRPKLARSLGVAAAEHLGSGARREPLLVFAQVSLDGDPDRGGAPIESLAALADAVAGQPGLRLAGLMAVPPIDADPGPAFERLAELSASLRRAHPDAGAISAGMSGDLETAVRHGATHLRVGTALLGRRAPAVH